MIKQIIIIGCLVFGICLTGCNKEILSVSNSNKIIKQKNKKQGEIFTVNTKIKDIINDSTFKGYGRLIFPADIKIDDNLRLQDIEEILPWYSEIQSKKSVEIINYMKQQVNNGNQIFYNIYSEEEKKKDPDKRNTGLFFFQGKKDAKTAITNAGGGFMYVAAIHDSFPHALELSKKGYNAFALIYRPGAQTACEDLARSIAFLYEHQKELQIDMEDYSLWGGSAGARMAAWLGSYGISFFGEKSYKRPGAVITSARRAGTTATLDQMLKYLLYAQMPVVSSRYWNMVHGQTPEQVLQDEEGVQIMRILGKNMAWMLKSIQFGKEAGLKQPEKEKRINTNFIH